jgi:acyl-CoA thioesterase
MKLAGFVKSPGFHLHREMRISPGLAERVRDIVSGKDSDISSRINVSTLAWCRFAQSRPHDALSASFFSDALIPLNLSLVLSTKGSKSYNPEVFYSWSTVGLTANFFGKPLEQPSGEDGNGHWLLIKADVQHTSEGRAELEMVLWDVDLSEGQGEKERKGRLVAVVRQQGVVVTRKRDMVSVPGVDAVPSS